MLRFVSPLCGDFSTGEPDARDSPVRFGGRGRNPIISPYPYRVDSVRSPRLGASVFAFLRDLRSLRSARLQSAHGHHHSRARDRYAITSLPDIASAENWPSWRGPRSTGVSNETQLPETWSDKTNVAWRTRLTGAGVSSPVVWGGQVFVTSRRIGRELCRPAPGAGRRPLGC